MRRLIAFVMLVLLLLSASACGKDGKDYKAVEEAIAETMTSYGLNDYKVTSASFSGTKVLCPEFEDLSDEKKYELLHELNLLRNLEVDGEEIDLDCDMYVKDGDSYYFYVPAIFTNAAITEAYGVNTRDSAGLFYQNGPRATCVYEVDWGDE